MDINTLTEINLTWAQMHWIEESLNVDYSMWSVDDETGDRYLESEELGIQIVLKTKENGFRISTWEV